MATKKQKNDEWRLFCINNSLVLIKGTTIIANVLLEPLALKKEIESQIQKGVKQPTAIFKKAVENLTGMKFCIKVREMNLSIHDSSYYKNYLEYIKSSRNLEKQHQRNQEIKEARKLYQERNRAFEEYKKENLRKMTRKSKNKK